jgi:hypothetical protein
MVANGRVHYLVHLTGRLGCVLTIQCFQRGSLNVRFAPKAIELLLPEMQRWARSRH